MKKSKQILAVVNDEIKKNFKILSKAKWLSESSLNRMLIVEYINKNKY